VPLVVVLKERGLRSRKNKEEDPWGRIDSRDNQIKEKSNRHPSGKERLKRKCPFMTSFYLVGQGNTMGSSVSRRFSKNHFLISALHLGCLQLEKHRVKR